MTYTSVGSNLGDTHPSQCTWVVFLCTSEAFLGLLFAGMCAAILFGKVNRVQSHANVQFSNAVCLQYEEIVDQDEAEFSERGDHRDSTSVENVSNTVPELFPNSEDEENQFVNIAASPSQEEIIFVDQFNGCPVLKFQVVNEFCNREGSEIVDCIMKVIGIKFKGRNGRLTHSQYVRVNLVDFEHPFLSRVWHGVHILDATSPLLTDKARHRIKLNNGSWPSNWYDPDVIRSKLEFHDLIVTVIGLSNVSAVTVHAYKRYKIGDVLIGFNFAPMVFRDTETGLLEVDLARANDVREQSGLRGESLSQRVGDERNKADSVLRQSSNIHITKLKSGDGLGDSEDVQSSGHRGSKRSSAFRISSVSASRHSTTKKADDLPDLPVIIRELGKSGNSEHEIREEIHE
jgi:hypothetical protein